MGRGHRDNRGADEPVVETEPETVDEAVAKLPKLADVYGGDDFSGAKNTGIYNKAPGVDYILPLNKPDVIAAYVKEGYVYGADLPGMDPKTGLKAMPRTHGPCPGHIIMACSREIADARDARRDKKNADVAKMLEQGTGGGSPEQESGDLEKAAVQVTRPG